MRTQSTRFRIHRHTVAVLLLVVLAGGCSHRKHEPLAANAPEDSGASWAPVPTDGSALDVPGSDRDGDGVTDDRERALHSNPDDPDTDRDNYSDGFEDRLADYGFDLLNPTTDSDHDGLPDDREAALGTNPRSPDTDRDGWSDFDEVLNGYFGFDPLVPTKDTDFDGLSDELERRLGSSPTNIDSNGDGITDFQAYAVDISPVGPPLPGPVPDLMGTTYSAEMKQALDAIRRGGRFPSDLAAQLPYPEVTAPLAGGGATRPSAALMQRSVYNPHHSPGLYPSYAEIERDLYMLASTYDGSPGAPLVRLFYWTGATQENCDSAERSRPGRRIYAVKVSRNPQQNDPEPEVLFMGTHHARELVTATHTMRLLHTLTDRYASDPDIADLVNSREVWVIPVVNPNGYDRAANVASQIDWRKNTHLVSGQTPGRCGVDVNRNYGFEHIAGFAAGVRKTLPNADFNGVSKATGNLLPDTDTYPGPAAFSEVESQAVQGLAYSKFLTERHREVDGLACSLSWHTYGGVVGNPMSHTPMAPNTGLSPGDIGPYAALTGAMAGAASYEDIHDTFSTITSVDGCSYPGYATYGDSEDWLYKDRHTFSVLIEAYSSDERGGQCPSNSSGAGFTAFNFYPQDPASMDAEVNANVQAGLAMLRKCPP